MRKRLNNLKLSFSTFHFCRTKRADAILPAAAAYRGLSPFNPKACDINFPRLLPAPPPTTPDETGLATRLKIPAAAAAFGFSRSWSNCSSESLEFAGRSTDYMTKIPLAAAAAAAATCEFGDGGPHWPEIPKTRNKLGTNKSGGEAAVVPWDELEEYEETVSLPFSSSSLSLDELIIEKDVKAAGGSGISTMGEAMAVVKKSSNPKEDFKRSMMEMISEKEIYDSRELEELLQCLLSLNSRHYHGHIVDAFSEIWEHILCGLIV